MPLPAPPALIQPAPRTDLARALQALERRSGGRLGVAVLDPGTGEVIGHRLDARFSFCSTFKVLQAGQVLAEVDAGRATLAERLPFGPPDLLGHAPVCRARLAEGALSLDDLCAATLQTSDNTAANLLFRRFGGPRALTAHLRGLGDRTTRSDREEEALNTLAPGDPRDTTTPRAMAHTLARLLVGNALSETSRTRLRTWMAGSTTGLRRLRAGFPAAWEVLDKTGTGHDANPVNDVALVTPPGGSPLVITCFLVHARGGQATREAVLAEVARLVARDRAPKPH